MTKAHYILNYFLINRRLKSLCVLLGNMPYKNVHKIVKNGIVPLPRVQRSFIPIISPSYWYEEAGPGFTGLFKSILQPKLNVKNNG